MQMTNNISLYPDVDCYGWNALACQDLIRLVMSHTDVAPNLKESVKVFGLEVNIKNHLDELSARSPLT